MDAPSLKRAASAATMGIGGLLWLAAILAMAQTAQNSEQFSRLHPWILGINIAGLVVLVGLLGMKLTQLIRDWRGHVIGSSSAMRNRNCSMSCTWSTSRVARPSSRSRRSMTIRTL